MLKNSHPRSLWYAKVQIVLRRNKNRLPLIFELINPHSRIFNSFWCYYPWLWFEKKKGTRFNPSLFMYAPICKQNFKRKTAQKVANFSRHFLFCLLYVAGNWISHMFLDFAQIRFWLVSPAAWFPRKIGFSP